ncbi:MAG: tripartite tricarboxylate transporter TctB family protein [Sphaerochaeta sp.]|jgi:hypothetical protein|nr:tripartite tricarboxylate transporter TctB family protein [Sphaerochaeta sp.]MCH3919817.1 tripartite tricarboxylate transporter TctB family protein [Sphaerochaeta sp.]MCI2096939.1 tripartite tricarboxylate transporter TctB family protein [Sphaerochaeta sp.]MCI2103955.1 tripartite tricarboxylate transporter TctB family protein [Sphaerochaeta sp.]
MRMHDFTKRSVLIPLCCMVFLLGYLGVALSMGPLLLDSGLTNENFIPVIISTGGILLCASIMRDELKRTEEGKHGPEEKKGGRFSAKQAILIADLFLFILLYYWVGIIPASFIFTSIFMIFFDDSICHVGKKLLLSAIITAIVYVLYAIVFGVHF